MPKIIYKDRNQFQKTLQNIKDNGVDNLHVISDFDRTLTPYQVRWKKVSTSFARFRDAGVLGEQYVSEAQRLFKQYYPIEIDLNISEEYRNSQMADWFRLHMELLAKSGVSEWLISELVAEGVPQLRDGGGIFLEKLHNQDVPLLILSSGVGDFIRIYLQSHHLDFPNIEVVSNLFDFDSQGVAISVKEPVIHVFSKDDPKICLKKYKDKSCKRSNIILLGDSLGDIKMSSGFEYDNILKIGFLNEGMDQVDAYNEEFDMLIMNDGSMEPILDILQQVWIQ